MSKLTNQWIELFRAGKAEGKPEFTSADIDQIVANYDPSDPLFHEAPATIGHPEGAAPAWGWFDGVARRGDVLLGKMRQVQPQFEEMVQSGLFKKRSVGLAKKDKGWYLHHVAFLGAKAPAIKGLADCVFGSEVEGLTQVEFQEDSMPDEKGFIEKLLNGFEERWGKKPGETGVTFSEAQVKEIAEKAAAEAVKPIQAKLDEQVATFAESQKATVSAATKARASEAIGALKTAGRWVPAFDKVGLPIVFAALATAHEVVEFGEGEGKKSQTPLDAFVAFMEQLPTIVPNAPVYTGQSGKRGANFSESPANADPNSFEMDKLVKVRMKEKGESYTVAFDAIAKDHVELLAPGGATAGQV